MHVIFDISYTTFRTRIVYHGASYNLNTCRAIFPHLDPDSGVAAAASPEMAAPIPTTAEVESRPDVVAQALKLDPVDAYVVPAEAEKTFADFKFSIRATFFFLMP